jgi:uncharacterized protein YcfJ
MNSAISIIGLAAAASLAMFDNRANYATSISYHPVSSPTKNQRKNRKDRRRAHAAGKKHAFA